MVDAFRAQLDALMGVNRNGDTVRRALLLICLSRASADPPCLVSRQGGTTDYRDKSVCRYFLEGLCPCELFVNTVRKQYSLRVLSVLLNAHTHTLISAEHHPLDLATLSTL